MRERVSMCVPLHPRRHMLAELLDSFSIPKTRNAARAPTGPSPKPSYKTNLLPPSNPTIQPPLLIHSPTPHPRSHSPPHPTTYQRPPSPSTAQIHISLDQRHLSIDRRIIRRRYPRLAQRHSRIPRLDIHARIQRRVELRRAGRVRRRAEVEHVGGLGFRARVAVCERAAGVGLGRRAGARDLAGEKGGVRRAGMREHGWGGGGGGKEGREQG